MFGKISAMLLALSLACGAPARMPVYEKLLVCESEHFRCIYTVSTAPLVPHVMRACEDAHALLTPFFRHALAGKMIVMVSDDMDIHNGWATTVPSPRMQIYLAASPPFSVIFEPGDELRRTVFHEYTHALTMDALYGARGTLAGIFGRVVPAGDPLSLLMAYFTLPPAIFAPDWYLEGLAIFSETEFAGAGAGRAGLGAGRGRSSIADMVLRMAVHDRRQLPPAAWDLHLPEWPEGDAAYLYGMRVVQYAREQRAANREHDDVPGALADAVNRSWPFMFDHRAVPVTGLSFDRLAQAAAAHEIAAQTARLDILRQRPFTPLQRLTPARLRVESPVFDATGQYVYFIGQGEADRACIRRYDLASGRVEKYPAARVTPGVGARLYPSADRRFLYYSKLEFVGRDRLWKQLFRFDTRTGQTCRLARDGRYQYPAVSPDARRLAAIRVAAGRHTLIVAPLPDAGNHAAEQTLYAPAYGRFLLEPVWLPDNETLLFVESEDHGSRIRRVKSSGGGDDVLLDWPCLIASPRLTPDGRALLFTADLSGVFNLYRLELAAGAAPTSLTHVPGGVFDVATAPDGGRMVLLNYDSYGYHLAELPDARERIAPRSGAIAGGGDALPKISPTWRADPRNLERARARAALPPPALTAPRDYAGWRNIALDYWSPWLTWSDAGAQAGLMLAASEPAGHHSFNAMAGYDTDAATMLGAAHYEYAGWYPLPQIFGAHAPQMYPGLIPRGIGRYADYYETASRAGAALAIPFPRNDRQWDLLAGYTWTKRAGLDRKNPDLTGVAVVPPVFEGAESAMFAGLRWFTGTVFNRSFSVEAGRLAQIMSDHAGLGGDLTRTRATGQWTEYITLPWGENHVLRLDGFYGLSAGDETAQGAFGVGGYTDAQGLAPGVARDAALRGYPQNYQTGARAARVSAAWRFPLVRCYRGASSTMPVYAHQLFGELFYDGGKAWGGDDAPGRDDAWIQSAGVELNYAFTLLRFVDIAPGIGLAHAFDRERRNDEAADEDVKWQLYLSFKGVVNF